MLERKKVTDFTSIVKGRILDKQDTLRKVDFNLLTPMQQVCHIIEINQLKEYEEFVGEFEQKVLKQVEDYGPVA